MTYKEKVGLVFLITGVGWLASSNDLLSILAATVAVCIGGAIFLSGDAK